MRTILTIALTTLSLLARAQVTLEHSYPTNYPMSVCHLEDYGDKYIGIDTATKNVLIYNADHSLWKTVNTGIPNGVITVNTVYLASQYLFNNDNKIEFIVCYYVTSPTITYTSKLLNEDGVLIHTFNNGAFPTIRKINSDWKLLINVLNYSPVSNYTEVYAVPGQWTGLTYAGKSGESNSIFPNPVESSATIRYELPTGLTQGSLNIYNMAGQQVRSYTVSNQFSDILINKGELPAGTYVYDIVTSAGRQAGQKFIVQ